MAKNIEMNIKQDNGNYEPVFPKTYVNNIIDINETLNNYFNKQETLTIETTQLYGLSDDAVPDNVLSFLGKYNQYWWKRRTVGGHYEIIKTPVTVDPSSKVDYVLVYISDGTRGTGYTFEFTLRYSDGVNIGPDGTITGLSSPIKEIKTTYDNYNSLSILKGKIVERRSFHISNGTISTQEINKYIGVSDTLNLNRDVNTPETQYAIWNRYEEVLSTKYVPDTPGNWEYIQSSERNTYPDSGEQDGYEYQYLGIPFENIKEAPKIIMGSYIGTGVYGVENPTTLIFSQKVKFIYIFRSKAPLKENTFNCINATLSPEIVDPNHGGNWTYSLMVDDIDYAFSDVTWNEEGNQVTWYASDARKQLNTSNYTYYYFALL